MSYETSPSTKLVASNCACCGKALADAPSVEAGMGPYCRQKHGYKKPDGDADWSVVRMFLAPHLPTLGLPDGWDTDVRRLANVLVHRIAVEQDGALAIACCNALRALGFVKLGGRVAARMAKIRVWEEAGEVVLKAPYSEELFSLPGRRYDKAREVTCVRVKDSVPTTKRAVLGALTRAFPGALVDGPRGLFVLPRGDA